MSEKAPSWVIPALLAVILALGSGAGWLVYGRLERIEADHGPLAAAARRVEDLSVRLNRMEDKLDRLLEGRR